MIKWGIIGVGNIALRFMKSLERSQNGELVAIASHNELTREKYTQFKTYENYEDLLRDKEVEAVYIALPHKYHAKWSIEALKHHKAVLCEKPACLSVAEMDQILETAQKNHTFYMEAMKTRFAPAFIKLQETIQAGTLGELLQIEAGFCGDSALSGKVPSTSYLFEMGQGGSWNDVGSYPLAFVLALCKAELKEVNVESVFHDHIDWFTHTELKFESGVKAIIETAIDRKKERTAVIVGTKGRIEVPMFNRATEFTIHLDNSIERITMPFKVDDFYDQIEEVNHCLLHKKVESEILPLLEIRREIEILELVQQKIIKEEN